MVLGKVAWGVAGAAGLYAVFLGILLQPPVQRFALYANKVNTLFLKNLNDTESFGFAPNQVTPFILKTPDNESLYAWHVLPADVYAENEREIRSETRSFAPVADITSTVGFRLLTSKEGPPARVVVYFHGNAGHVGENWRPDTYRYMAAQPNTHVLTIDYRGFGYSTGSPTEAGLIIDGTALVNWVLRVAKIPAERIVIAGQSLGTGVSSAIALHFADPSNMLIPAEVRSIQNQDSITTGAVFAPTTFAGVVLAAPFSSIPALLLTYRVGGLLPLLLPLRPVPALAGRLTALMEDKWLSAERLTAYYAALADRPGLLHTGTRSLASVQLVHALNDRDIPFHQTEMICRRMFGMRDSGSEVRKEEIEADECIDGGKGAGVLDVNRPGRPRVRFEIVRFGGHNRIITYSSVSIAISRAFGDHFE